MATVVQRQPPPPALPLTPLSIPPQPPLIADALDLSPLSQPMTADTACYSAEPSMDVPLEGLRMTDELFALISEYRANGYTWKGICSVIQCLPALTPEYLSYLYYRKVAERKPTSQAVELQQKQEHEHEHEHEQEQEEVVEDDKLAAAASSTSAGKTSVASSSKSLASIVHLTLGQFYTMQRLVRKHGENWDLIAAHLGIRQRDLKRCWRGYSVNSRVTTKWTDQETELLCQCVDANIDIVEAALIIGTKIPRQCRYKLAYLKREERCETDRAEGRDEWSKQAEEYLVRLIKNNETMDSIDWDATSQLLNKDAAKCKARYVHLQAKHAATPSASQIADISKEVERQHETRGLIDWAEVGRAAGVPELTCLEHNTYEGGKRAWTYRVETFSWATANRMRTFIMKYYPGPTARINFIAVSNYMWINAGDCIHMNDLLLGKFEWSASALAALRRLCTTGMSNKEIAKQLSPGLSEGRVALAMHFINKKEHPDGALKEGARHTVQRIIDEHAGKLNVAMIRLVIRRNLPLCHRDTLEKWTNGAMLAHPFYIGKVKDTTPAAVFKMVAEGGMTTRDVAEKLDVPDAMVTNMLKEHSARRHTKSWTPGEVGVLMALAASAKGKRNWRYISDRIGTKSPKQCRSKHQHLRNKPEYSSAQSHSCGGAI
ncbi:hypothetical protein GQ54DRAFT_298558 [Martensiomyces pterosporus]|nr:hypothetical protein GQ54DRAFT_298558 [Martensiomyces pterosporus]